MWAHIRQIVFNMTGRTSGNHNIKVLHGTSVMVIPFNFWWPDDQISENVWQYWIAISAPVNSNVAMGLGKISVTVFVVTASNLGFGTPVGEQN